MNLSALATQLALDLAAMIRDGRLPEGYHLREEPLARQFAVSRSPLREALKALSDAGVVVHRANRGFFVEPREGSLDAVFQWPRETEESIYRTIAEKRLSGEMPLHFTEADLSRLLKLSRAQASRVTARMAQEGWIEPRPGYGWKFVPVLTTPEAFAGSYRFRLAVEPAALLEPTFVIDQEAFDRCRQQQETLIASHMRDIDPVELFRLGSTFHEVLVRCSGNPFFIDAIMRITRLRRLLEYRAMVEPKLFVEQARQHLQILDLIEAGDRNGAASVLRDHLNQVRIVKVRVLESKTSEQEPGADAGNAKLELHLGSL